MASSSHVTDEEMLFYQYKARQMVLKRKEDHQWREFCRTTSCNCCSCNKTTCDCCSCTTPATREVAVQAPATRQMAVQAAPKKKTVNASQGTNLKSLTSGQSKIQPDILNDINKKLESINLAVSGKRVNTKEEKTIDQTLPKMLLPRNISQMDSIVNEKRLDLIQRQLKQSLDRLHSAGKWKNPPMLHPKKESGFLLPRDLQKQRTLARNAYLASLSKTPLPKTSMAKEKISSQPIKTQVKTQTLQVVSKTRSKSHLQLKKEKQEENSKVSSQLKDATVSKFPHIIPQEEPVGITVKPSGNRAKIRHSSIKRLPEEQSSRECAKQNPLEKAMDSDSKRTDMSGEENKLFIDKKTFHEIMSYRDCYASYLERTKKGNFDPCTESNTVSESILEDCVEEVLNEVEEHMGAIITDIYDDEFIETL